MLTCDTPVRADGFALRRRVTTSSMTSIVTSGRLSVLRRVWT